MQYLDVDTELARLYYEAQMLQFERLKSIQKAFPDVEIVVDGAGRRYYCSAEANPAADEVEFQAPAEGPVLAKTFVQFPLDGRLYSAPPWHVVGETRPRHFGIVPATGWDQELKSDGISDDIVKRVGQYLEQRPPVSYEV